MGKRILKLPKWGSNRDTPATKYEGTASCLAFVTFSWITLLDKVHPSNGKLINRHMYAINTTFYRSA